MYKMKLVDFLRVTEFGVKGVIKSDDVMVYSGETIRGALFHLNYFCLLSKITSIDVENDVILINIDYLDRR